MFQLGTDWVQSNWSSNRFDYANSNQSIVHDNLTGKDWPRDASTPTYGSCVGGYKNWADALKYVSCLNSANYLGYNDWRLPNISELESLVNPGAQSPSSWLMSQGFTNVMSSFYWSSTTYAFLTGRARYISMIDGDSRAYYKTSDSYNGVGVYVLPVRNGMDSITTLWKTGLKTSYAAGDDGELQIGEPWPSPRFVENSDSTVTDNLIGLIWAKDAGTPAIGSCNYDSTSRDWYGALKYIDCLNSVNYLGHDDWRLPNRKELMSLYDQSVYEPALMAGHPFINVGSYAYWTSTTVGSDTSRAFTGNVGYGTSSSEALKASTLTGGVHTVWPVRSVSGDCSIKRITYMGQIPASGGSYDMTVETSDNMGCAWMAYANKSWIKLNDNYESAVKSVFSYTVEPNTTTSSRTGKIVFKNIEAVITQDGQTSPTPTPTPMITPTPTPNCSTTAIGPSSNNFTATGGSGSVSVTANTGCTWNASSNASWITLTYGLSGSGNGTVNYTVAANTSTTSRTGTMTIAGQTFTVTQGGQQSGQLMLTVTKQGTGDGTVTATNGGITWNGKTGTASYDKDTSVTLTAAPALGSTIKAWTGCDLNIGSNQCMVKMTTDKSISIEFDGGSGKKVEHDFNGDGHSDILWRNTKTGDVYIWLMDGTKITGGNFIAKGITADWNVKAIGDFNGDGKSDVMWQNNAGDVYIWIVNGTTITTGGFAVRGMPGEWEVTTLGDFNGDGNTDIMWRNTNSGDIYVWFLDATTISGGGYLIRGMMSEWVVKAVADFNGDGKSDVLWQNTTTGDVAMWLMDSLSMSTGNYVVRAVPNEWQIKAVNDFDGDGKADIIWQNTNTGDVVIWLMNGMSISSGDFIQRGVPRNWQIKVAGDYNGDGKADILWQETTNGDVYMYVMDGKNITDGGYVAFGLGTDWQPK
ncbi:MAG: DUF1566 domain-containing protein [Nitrospirae bacterium]|nr:DUF1566 domain-containing protein [Nitrospirota bacterium]